MNRPVDLSVIVSSCERHHHLLRCLQSLAQQQQLGSARFEVIVADDGSQDETPQIVDAFARQSSFPVTFVTHPKDGYRKAKAMNAGLRESRAPYLLLTDGDCIFPPTHLAQHLAARRPGVVRAGNAISLDEALSQRIDVPAIRSGEWLQWVPGRLDNYLRKFYLKSLVCQTLHRSMKKLVGNNVGLWRHQLESINGFDERYRGWGCEDDDLGIRLRQSNQRIMTILGRTHAYHLWHPRHETRTSKWRDGCNVDYVCRPMLLTACLQGLRPFAFEDLSVRVLFGDDHSELGRQLKSCFLGTRLNRPDLEIIFWPCDQRFRGDASHNIVITDANMEAPREWRKSASAVIQLPARPAKADSNSASPADWLLRELAARLGVKQPEASTSLEAMRSTSRAVTQMGIAS